MENKASTADMVRDAIKTLGERGGSSLHNIKKYIEAVYQVSAGEASTTTALRPDA